MASDKNESAVNPELESFRQQWISDLQSQKEKSGVEPIAATSLPSSSSASRPPKKHHHHPPPPAPTTTAQTPRISKDDSNEDSDADESYLPGRSFIDDAAEVVSTNAPSAGKKKLVSALDHYEEAMVKEAQGNMGDSLRLYRQAYRLDTRVDKVYREKHHAGGAGGSSNSAKFAPKANEAAPSSSSHPSQKATPAEKQDQAHTAPPLAPEPEPVPVPVPVSTPILVPIDDLIASFAALKVEPAAPIIEGDIPPPCPISKVPDEILIHIMNHVAIADVGDFARLALVCKRLAYLVATEQRIWKRVCLGAEFGFSALHRRWARGIEWEALEEVEDEAVYDGSSSSAKVEERRRAEATSLTKSLMPSVYPTWKNMFRNRPRIRFNGCYISTVNYIRSGQHATNHATWGGAPVLIVTYYRYLRFFRDGTLISLLSTQPPIEVVHSLTREQLLLHRQPNAAHAAPSVMSQAYRGRWRLSSSSPSSSSTTSSSDDDAAATAAAAAAATTNLPPKDLESDLFIETEGVEGKYTYRMDLSLQSAGKAAARNNKLAWKRFYCYNKLTDDWGDFHLKNDKPFFFSRVKSYGVGVDEI